MNSIPNPADFFKEKVIGGKRYTIKPLGGRAAWKGWTLILKTVAPIMGEVLDSGRVSEEAAMFEKSNMFREVLTIIASNACTPEVDQLIEGMLVGATCEGQSFDIDSHFMGKAHHMMDLVIFALEVNFKSFFTESDTLQSIMGGLTKMMGGTLGE